MKKIINTMDPSEKPSIVMIVYGHGGVGKTTFAATAPKPLIVDCENGSKYFGLRGIKCDVLKVSTWADIDGLFDVARSGKYETIAIDPIGELMEKLRNHMLERGDRKYVQTDGSPSIAGWGWIKDTMKTTLKILRDTGINLVLVAHVSETEDEGKVIKRPMIMTKIAGELINMVDIVGYMVKTQVEGEERHVIIVDPSSDKFEAKDRTGQLGKYIPPDFGDIVKACQGTKKFKWMKAGEKKVEAEQPPEVNDVPKEPTAMDKEIEAKKGDTGIEKVLKVMERSTIKEIDATRVKMSASKKYTAEQKEEFERLLEPIYNKKMLDESERK